LADVFISSVVTLKSFEFEKAAVLFNEAAICSQLGTTQNLDSAEGNKKACKFFEVRAPPKQTHKKAGPIAKAQLFILIVYPDSYSL
jgi:hypothetical protein